jgi:transcriptional regulator with XRE-family HTH domain
MAAENDFPGRALQIITALFAKVGLELEREVREMFERDRKLLRKRLDEEMRHFRRAGKKPGPTNGLLRAVRQVLQIPMAEIAQNCGVGRSGAASFERREVERTITLRSLGRMAEAMGCKVVYGVVPINGKTLEYLAEERLWRKVFSAGNRDQKDRDGGLRD